MLLNLPVKYKSLDPFNLNLPDLTILTGVNGAGKTQILSAIIETKASVSENNQELNPKKYVTHQTLSPNDSNIITRQSSLQEIEDIWNPYHNFQQQNKLRQYNLNQFVNDPKQVKILVDIANKTNKDINELSQEDVYLHRPIHITSDDIFYQNFSGLFKRYQDKFDENRYQRFISVENNDKSIIYLSNEDFITENGEAPWDFVNKIIKEANLDYHINSPSGIHRDAPFELKLVNNITGTEVKFSDLSSGEKVLMSLALALYNSKFSIEFPKVLLMDEPDASLHPSMSKQFLDVILNVFVKDKGVKVIMTTHSPSTVALAPEESLFVVNKSGQRLEKSTKDHALKILTSGVPSFSVNYENRRQVFVESKYDVIFYEKIYNKLKSKLIKDISLNFISSGVAGAGNCDQVIDIVERLTSFGNKFVFGIIDWDIKNNPQGHILVLGHSERYSLENYIFDPILLCALLLSERLIERADLGLTNNETYSEFRNLSNPQLQLMSDFIINKVSDGFDITKSSMKKVIYGNNSEISIPEWYLENQGHNLEAIIKNKFPQLNKFNKEEGLKKEIINKIIDDIPEFIPKDILDLFHSIQDMD
ncbi:AAA family ATPase [Hymenobacter psychrophilus]|uniref:AAA domain-containing protein, putative AbiEii toxin, Type IV TA system n=1 Tax=Hymenobacter psychrophilus TaxID=651662 RepID=A0A1H3CQM0_9BACT|nr:AAA family ATPase [Hymenobacter psychrophilus]SDX56451.1 AAA domain-containing protein, putative AbiEii toxin, Type IV TA system [Hymenobacter psychrophilus]